MQKYIYNVVIGGTSVGLTFNHAEASRWVKDSKFIGSKQIFKVGFNG
jgi:hypothetical protein